VLRAAPVSQRPAKTRPSCTQVGLVRKPNRQAASRTAEHEAAGKAKARGTRARRGGARDALRRARPRRLTGPSRARQVILAIDPLFSILLGLAVDRSETKLGPLGWTGGGILIGACLIASRFARAH